MRRSHQGFGGGDGGSSDEGSLLLLLVFLFIHSFNISTQIEKKVNVSLLV